MAGYFRSVMSFSSLSLRSDWLKVTFGKERRGDDWRQQRGIREAFLDRIRGDQGFKICLCTERRQSFSQVRCERQPFEVPRQMFAKGEKAAFAITFKVIGHVEANDANTFFDRDGFKGAAGKDVFNLFENPRISQGCTADKNAVAAGFF